MSAGRRCSRPCDPSADGSRDPQGRSVATDETGQGTAGDSRGYNIFVFTVLHQNPTTALKSNFPGIPNVSSEGSLYREAGVDIKLAQDLLGSVKQRIEETRRPEVLEEIAGFGGLFQLDVGCYREPVLVSSIDGVGTKLMIARLTNQHETIGRDLVNHCVNDIATVGAEPLYFMDYIGIGKLRSPLFEDVLSGMAEACTSQDISILGGETAEMPGIYGDDYDVVGSITGVVEKSKMITGAAIGAGHVIVGLGSSGLHTNGYSLARMILFAQSRFSVDTELSEIGEPLGRALLRPHLCYWPAIKKALAADLPVHGMAHITGGGFYDNIPRMIPDKLHAVVMPGVLPCPPIFAVIQTRGNISDKEMYHVFNMGVGMVWIVPPEAADSAADVCRAAGFEAAAIGEIADGAGPVQIRGIDCE